MAAAGDAVDDCVDEDDVIVADPVADEEMLEDELDVAAANG